MATFGNVRASIVSFGWMILACDKMKATTA
jgi:hypothetical protein